jgi:L-ornithine Nalpha-acyltransferase
MQEMTKGCYRVRPAVSPADIRACQALRHLAFHPQAPGDGPAPLDCDSFDPLCTHVMVEDLRRAALVACFRMLDLTDGGQIGQSYAAQFYDLSALAAFPGRMVEIGRFCIHPDCHDPDVLRLAWAALTRHVDAAGIEMMFGCSSFHGTDQARYLDSFAMLRAGHLAPPQWRPGVKAHQVYRFGARLRRRPDRRRGLLTMPPLLRTYLLMGGWVSDHAVIDTQMNTLHVFTGLEVSAIPDARKRLLRAVSA